MCGICGIVSLEENVFPASATADLQRMLTAMLHRGPQGSGIRRSGDALFGAQRLAIRGLDDGQQPLFDEASGVMAVCNGEIDNHKDLRQILSSRGREVVMETDVAIIPALYLEFGEEFVAMLEGPFALALFDPRASKLLLARDRAGEHPVFFCRRNNSVAFATEVAALKSCFADPIVPNPAAIHEYVQAGFFPGPAAIFEGFEKIAAGEMAIFTPVSSVKKRYWRWPVREAPKHAGDVKLFDSVFREAIRRQSDLDVDFGIFLSGGLDSSLIASVMRSVRPQYKPPCYTLRFSEGSYDEGEYAEKIARHLGLETISVSVTAQDMMTMLPEIVAACGEPLADPAWIPTALLAHRASADVRVVFGGEGADELFGGYPTYLGAKLAKYYNALPLFVRAAIKNAAAVWPASDKKMPLSYLIKKFAEAGELGLLTRHREWNAPVPRHNRERMGFKNLNAVKEQEPGALFDILQLHDIETLLAEGLLTKADRGGMLSSVEIRAPFLDRHVMEFAATLLPRDKISGLRTKTFLKRYAEKYVPSEIIYRRKRGLSIPVAKWLRGPMRQWAAERLSAGRLAEAGINSTEVETLWAHHQEKKADHAKGLWALLVLDEWLQWNAVQAGLQEAEPPLKSGFA